MWYNPKWESVNTDKTAKLVSREELEKFHQNPSILFFKQSRGNKVLLTDGLMSEQGYNYAKSISQNSML